MAGKVGIKVQPNNNAKAGRLASRRLYFGSFSRYAVAAVHTRFDSVSFFVWDADKIDDVTGRPAVIRQCDTLFAATMNLEQK